MKKLYFLLTVTFLLNIFNGQLKGSLLDPFKASTKKIFFPHSGRQQELIQGSIGEKFVVPGFKNFYQQIVESQKGDECGMKTLENIQYLASEFLLKTPLSKEQKDTIISGCPRNGSDLSSEEILKAWKKSNQKFEDKQVDFLMLDKSYILLEPDLETVFDLIKLSNSSESRLDYVADKIVTFLQKSEKSVCGIAFSTGGESHLSAHWFAVVFFKDGKNLTAVIADSLGYEGNIDRRENQQVIDLYKAVAKKFNQENTKVFILWDAIRNFLKDIEVNQLFDKSIMEDEVD